LAKFTYRYSENTGFYAIFKTAEKKLEKIANKKVTGKKGVEIWSLTSSLLLTGYSFWSITFSRCICYQLFQRKMKKKNN
jgi:hypothetical protein